MPMMEVSTLSGAIPSPETFANHSGTLAMEVFRIGDYGRKGRFDEAALDQLAMDYNEDVCPAPVTIDHVQEGAAYGWVTRLWREGGSLWAEMDRVSSHLVDAVRSGRFRTRSVEIIRKLPETGRAYFAAVSFLGAALPHVRGMADVIFRDGGDHDVDDNGDDMPHSFRFRDQIPRDLWAGEPANDSSNSSLPADDGGGNSTNSQDEIQMSDTNAANTPLNNEAPAASPDATSDDARFAEIERERDLLRNEMNALREQFANERIGREVERFSAHFDSLVAGHKAIPAERDHALAIFSAIQTGSGKVTFGAGDEASETSLANAFRAMFDARPDGVFSHLSGDVASPAPGAAASNRADDGASDGTVSSSSGALLTRARALMSANSELTIDRALIEASKTSKTEGTAYAEATQRD